MLSDDIFPLEGPDLESWRLGVSAALFPLSVYPPNNEDAPLVKLDELVGLNAEVLPLVEECPEVARALFNCWGESPSVICSSRLSCPGSDELGLGGRRVAGSNLVATPELMAGTPPLGTRVSPDRPLNELRDDG